eukprot:CAMPEP_0114282786 /NCGR_PEP_ID=MMETSP0059-20121206/3744_1 /TAXON_ID=36894 /ORGANISM="Pyramimonas parkeae, Strain CCMP726" /LENGTH=155 /DNA_ID=CAMNT_0001403451 /DNA_START=70 /DNA_END=537 /DNA_ORIENTATION=-
MTTREILGQVSEADVRRVVDGMFENNTVEFVHPHGGELGHRVSGATKAQWGAGLTIPASCQLCRRTGTCASTELYAQWLTVQVAHKLMEAQELKRGALFRHVLRLRPDMWPNRVITQPWTERLLADEDRGYRICRDEDRAAADVAPFVAILRVNF